jgi:hypothetical protein
MSHNAHSVKSSQSVLPDTPPCRGSVRRHELQQVAIRIAAEETKKPTSGSAGSARSSMLQPRARAEPLAIDRTTSRGRRAAWSLVLLSCFLAFLREALLPPTTLTSPARHPHPLQHAVVIRVGQIQRSVVRALVERSGSFAQLRFCDDLSSLCDTTESSERGDEPRVG